MGFLDDDKKEKLNTFVKFVKDQLELKTVPTISIQNGRNGLKTTANYDYNKENKVVKVNAKNRALVDVMRSIAHEMVHHKQNEEGRLKSDSGKTGSEIENEANAKAGKVEVTDMPALVLTLQKALHQCTLLNQSMLKASLIDAIIEFIPDFTESAK